MPEPYELLIEIAAFAPLTLNVTDTCPTCPGGWRARRCSPPCAPPGRRRKDL
jgi:hypothetical protein